MLDTAVRARLAPALDAVAARSPLSAGALTATGLAVGIGACVAAALALWPLALVLWLLNRALDGLDGAVARRRGPTDLGGLLDFAADFVVYGGFVVGVAIAEPDARIAVCVLLATYLLNNVVLLSLASLLEKRRVAGGDERSLRFTPALTEGTETIAAYALLCLLPAQAEWIASAFAAMVLVSVAQRLVLARRLLA
jgi:phosphatidylglycerophosphate synthase